MITDTLGTIRTRSSVIMEQGDRGAAGPTVRGGQSTGRAPASPNARAASRQPLASASIGGFLSSQGGRKPAQNASPAPVPSTNFSTGFAGTRTGPRPFANTAPSGPSFTTTSGYKPASSRIACTASSPPVATSHLPAI